MDMDPSPRQVGRNKVSAVVISYNRESLIRACLLSVRFADEVIVVDKSSTDGTRAIAESLADRVIVVPWSPVVEDTRAQAFEACSHDWIISVDDDELLSPEAIRYIERELVDPSHEVYFLAQRHYILGVHDERAYYWPEYQPRLFHKGAVSFSRTVHSGYVYNTENRCCVPFDDGVCVHHLSHRNVAEWIEKTNRYTSIGDRSRTGHGGNDLIAFAHGRIDHWRGRSRIDDNSTYPVAVALARAIYDLIDRLKAWEEEEGLDGVRAFAKICADLEKGYAAVATPGAPHEGAVPEHPEEFQAASQADSAQQIIAALKGSLRQVRAMAEEHDAEIRARFDAQVESLQAQCAAVLAEKTELALEKADLMLEKSDLAMELKEAQTDLELSRGHSMHVERRLHEVSVHLDSTLRSASWRLTAPLRDVAERHPRLLRAAKDFVHRHPTLKRTSVRTLRAAVRLVNLRHPLRRYRLSSGLMMDTDNGSPRLPASTPVVWFFIGDTMDWLDGHTHLTGVGRVTHELLAANLGAAGAQAWYPAVACAEGVGLAAYKGSPRREGSDAARDFQELLDEVGAPDRNPQPGDHVLFTGAVWTADYAALFRRLAAEGVRFTVLVHDIIPITSPEFVGPDYAAGFEAWLRVVVQEATVILVSGPYVRDQLGGWCEKEGLTPKHPVEVIPFGADFKRASLGVPDLGREVPARFVLSVGTVDRRKNQALLCRTWVRLAADLDPERLPALVLAGRDDIGLADAIPELQPLLDAEKVVILSRTGDAELDVLYRTALFTAFPSLAEGYGLPIAESLSHGKLPVCSDLPPVQDFAGELAWYFNPEDADDAYRAIRNAIENDQARSDAEDHILNGWRPGTWSGTSRLVASLIAPHLASGAMPPIAMPEFTFELSLLDLHKKARQWCSTYAPDVSILIINWNAAAMTQACIRHLWARTSGVTYEILVADNGSKPADLAALKEYGPGVTLCPLGTNRYFGEANNILAERAKGKYLCLLNNDVFVSDGWLERLVAALEGNDRAGAVGPVFLFPDGVIQEAGGGVNAEGFPERHHRGQPLEKASAIAPARVDYISAAALLMRRETYLAAGGFDLAFEPAYYEDTDLCFKVAALGKEVWLCPDVRVVHLEGFSTGDEKLPSADKRALGDLNRDKFVSRWGEYLDERSPFALDRIRDRIVGDRNPRRTRHVHRRHAMLYSPYQLTPGGGERYLLTLAHALCPDHDVTIATPNPYSKLRVLDLGHEFDLDLSGCSTAVAGDMDRLPPVDLMVSMSNHAVPPVPARGKRSFYLCQFPFPMSEQDRRRGSPLAGYEAAIVYSHYARINLANAISGYQLPDIPIKVVYPPVTQIPGNARRKKNIILTVGRFFVGGHSKRHDLMIKAFRRFCQGSKERFEFHIAGSSMPGSEHMEYLNNLQKMAADLPVVFHVNGSGAKLMELYRDAAVYWHATGLGAELHRHPELAEHFGIAIVEAMSAQCVTFALNSGGAREIITDGVDGFLYDTQASLIERTLEVLAPRQQERRVRIGEAGGRRSLTFTLDAFTERVRAEIG